NCFCSQFDQSSASTGYVGCFSRRRRQQRQTPVRRQGSQRSAKRPTRHQRSQLNPKPASAWKRQLSGRNGTGGSCQRSDWKLPPPLRRPENLARRSRTRTDEKKGAAAGALIGGGEQGLLASKFRYLNEQLYTLSSADAFEMFKADPEAFKVYHAGYSAQRQRWTEDPIDWVAKQCRLGLPAGSSVLVDFGCGDARLASRLEGHCAKVHSLDLVALNNRVTACDMARCPLGNGIAHGAVFCLSLMNANLSDFLAEASRVLRLNGLLCIVEARSRIERTQRFVNLIERFGFQCQRRREDKYLVYLLFNKSRNRKAGEPLPELRLKPCLYKKR
uniref:Ribosomal RNA-processing protein 8 n=1 Tax=Macrostomum lignano TaxID=282301 RepID=A0A1I8IDY0_9PLAT